MSKLLKESLRVSTGGLVDIRDKAKGKKVKASREAKKAAKEVGATVGKPSEKAKAAHAKQFGGAVSAGLGGTSPNFGGGTSAGRRRGSPATGARAGSSSGGAAISTLLSRSSAGGSLATSTGRPRKRVRTPLTR